MAALTLAYASPRRSRVPWGPIVFRPSRRSLVLLVLAASCFTWLYLRHAPWSRKGRIWLEDEQPLESNVQFTPDGDLLTLDRLARTWAVDSGAMIANLGAAYASTSQPPRAMNRGREILQLSLDARTARVLRCRRSDIAH